MSRMRTLKTAVALLALAGLIGLPLAALVREVVTAEGALEAALESERYRERAIFSLAQAAGTTALSAALGLLVAYAFAGLLFPGRTLVRVVASLPLLLPPVVMALAVRQALSPLGIAVPSLTAVLFAHVAWGTAIVAWLCSVGWRSVDRRTRETARTLGASPWMVFRRISWPVLQPWFRVAVALSFILTLTSFAAPLLLGGPDEETVAVVLYHDLLGAGDRGALAALALGQSLVLLLVVIYVSGSFARLARIPRRVTPPARGWRRMRRSERLMLPAALLIVLVLTVWPLGALVRATVSAVLDGEGGAGDRDAIITSGWLALVAGLLAALVGHASMVGLGWVGGWGAVLRPWLLSPLLLGPVSLGLGVALVYDIDLPSGAPGGALLLAHIAIGCIAALTGIAASRPAPTRAGRRAEEAARLLGAPAWRSRSMRRTSWWRLVAIGTISAAATSLGELGATALLGGDTLPVTMLAAPEQGETLVLATALLACAVVAIVAIERLRRSASG